jgi:beta-glucosidase
VKPLVNAGRAAGEEVVQFYVGVRSSEVDRVPKELKAFTKVSLAPGETRIVRLAVSAADFTYYDAVKGWIVEPGEYEVIGSRHSLDDKALRARFMVG